MARTLIYRRVNEAPNTGTGVEMYWDTAAHAASVVSIPDSAQTPYYIGYNILIDSYCVGSTLVEAKTVWDGAGRAPRREDQVLIKIETANSSACAVPNNCGLQIQGITVAPSGSSYTATISVTGATGEVEYSLNGFVDVQDSPVFTGLTAGQYTAYARIKNTSTILPVFGFDHFGTSRWVKFDDKTFEVLVYEKLGFNQTGEQVFSGDPIQHGFVGQYLYPKDSTGTPRKFLATSTFPYAVYADSQAPYIPCIDTETFVVKEVRNPRFFMQFKGKGNTTHRVEWLKEGYTGEAEELRGGDNPLRIEYPGTGNKTDVLSGSGASVEILVQREGLMKDLYSVDEREYLVDYTVDGVLKWRGYHMPDVYNEPWVSIPFYGTIQAYDGIGSLKNKPYLDANGVRYYGRARSIDVIFRCLRLLDLNLPVWLAVNIWEDTMDLGIEPLSQSYVDQGAYYDSGNKSLSCEEVLTRILQPYNAFLKQANGALHIIRLTETKGAYNRRKATIGEAETMLAFDLETQEFEEVHTIRQTGDVSYREASQVLTSRPGYKTVTTVTNYGEYENFVYNGDFEQWVNGLPSFWELKRLEVAQVLAGEKYLLGFPSPALTRIVPGRRISSTNGELKNAVYPYEVSSSTGFTFKFDYHIIIDDFLPKDGIEWIIYPEFEVEGQIVKVTNEAQANFNGQIVNYPTGQVRDGISPGAGRKRIDILYAKPDGTYEYEGGITNAELESDIVRQEPDNCLLVSYFTWEGDQAPKLSSVSSFLEVGFISKVAIGEYSWGDRRETPITTTNVSGPRDTRGGAVTGIKPQTKSIAAKWYADAENNYGRVITRLNGFSNSDGYTAAKGTVEINTTSMLTPGLPYVWISNAHINRDNLRGVVIAIDNVVFQETDTGTDKMLITGENEGQINTPPFELDLHHGSGIPRTEALITLADGTPTVTWGGQFLQERTARDILAQHTRASLVMSASLTGPVSPISILKDIHLPNARFLVDKYTYHAREGLTRIEAFEIFGGAEDVLSIPEKAMLYEDGTAMLYEDGTYMLYE